MMGGEGRRIVNDVKVFAMPALRSLIAMKKPPKKSATIGS